MTSENPLIRRRAEAAVREALTDTRVVAINGARQVGKSTLVRLVADSTAAAAVRALDAPGVRLAAVDDPVGFVEHDGLLVIDEIQEAPDLVRAIKVAVDTDPRPGRFLLTGSSRILGLRSLPDSLTGRIEIIELWPFSQGELDPGPDAFVDAAFAVGDSVRWTGTLRKGDLLARAVRGGYPEAVARSGRRRTAFFDALVGNLIDRDIMELSRLQRRGELRVLLNQLAARAGGLVNASALAMESGISRSTVNRHLELLDAVFVVKLIPSWSTNTTRRAVGTPKLAFVDSGVLSYLLGQDETRLGAIGGAAGQVLENFVVMELARQLTWSDSRARLHHYRDKDGTEVDAVLETPDGRVVGVEVKAGATIRSEDLRGLRHLAGRLGDRWIAGYVMYTGTETLSYGDRILGLPMEALWRFAPPT